MLTPFGHLTYCTNIHKGENWGAHFEQIKDNFPFVKIKISPDKPMGMGLRLSNQASLDLINKDALSGFKEWLSHQDAYVFTMNGFPYGGFHQTTVKDQVHAPDWTKMERVDYTIRLFKILSELLPEGMDGGISTSPLSYRLWYKTEEALKDARMSGTKNIISVLEFLIEIYETTGKVLHLDVEPEPDGLLGSGKDFTEWFEMDILPTGVPAIAKRFGVSRQKSEDMIKQHLRLCYDVCHIAVGFEDQKRTIHNVLERGIKIGKIQISAALKGKMNRNKASDKSVVESFRKFDEPTYLHQVTGRTSDGNLLYYPDLPEAIQDVQLRTFEEWRAHFHVPVFTEKLGVLSTTQDEIVEVLNLQMAKPFTQHLEVETYTWEVLPGELRLPLKESIMRELQWVKFSLV
jgi:hypothetical protein